jgi:hypothetical protein
MYRYKGMIFFWIAICAIVSSMGQLANAGTIIKLSLGGDSAADIEFSGGAGGILSTVNDGVGGPASPGDQNTSVDFLDFLSDIPDIITNIASYSLNGVKASGPALLFAGLVTQPFVDGNFQIYDPAGALLLDVDLGSSVFNSGALGGTGSSFSVTNGSIVGGSLQPRIVDNSISFSIAMTNIVPSSPPLFTPSDPPADPPGIFTLGTLNEFTGDGSKLIAAEVPEPMGLVLATIGSASAVVFVSRRRRNERVEVLSRQI